jgi:hypothetical protein
MPKVYIDMDEGFRWWPVLSDRDLSWLPPEYHATIRDRETPTMEIPQELLDRYEAVALSYRELQAAFEQLYRIQQNLQPWPGQAIPDYTLIRT